MADLKHDRLQYNVPGWQTKHCTGRISQAYMQNLMRIIVRWSAAAHHGDLNMSKSKWFTGDYEFCQTLELCSSEKQRIHSAVMSQLSNVNLKHVYFNSADHQWLVWFILRPCQHNDSYIDGRSQIKVYTNERTLVHSTWSSLTVTYLSTNRDQRCLINLSERRHRKPIIYTQSF